MRLAIRRSGRNESESSDVGTLERIDDAFARHQREAQSAQRDHHRARQWHGFLIYALGIPSATLAVAAGSSALANGPTWLTAGVAFLSAAFGAAMAAVGPAQARSDHDEREADYGDLARFARRTWLRVADGTEEQQLAALEAVDTYRHQLDRRPVRGPDQPAVNT